MRYESKTTTADIVRGCFTDIRSAIEEMHTNIDESIKVTFAKIKKNKVRLRDEAFIIEKRELEDALTGTMRAEHKICETAVRPVFAILRDVIREWSLSKPQPDIIDSLKLFHDFDVVPTAGEIESLFDKANGNYLSMRLINAVASAAGLQISDTPSVDTLMREIDRTEENTISNIYSFAGSIVDDHIPGVDYLEIDYPYWSIFNAAVFLEADRETSLSRLEKLLAENTETIDTAIQLTPRKRAEIDGMFSDCQSETDKINLAKRMLENDYGQDSVLAKYDHGLYMLALTNIGYEADARLQEMEEQRKKLDSESEKVRVQGARSHAELDKMSARLT